MVSSDVSFAPDCAHWYIAGNCELLGFWVMSPFSGDFFSPMQNVAPGILIFCGTLGLCLEIGLPSCLSQALRACGDKSPCHELAARGLRK